MGPPRPRPSALPTHLALPVFLAVLAAAPLLSAAALAIAAAWDRHAWQMLWASRQTWPALAMSVWTGLASTALALAGAAWLLAHGGTGHGATSWTMRLLAPMLAVPHAAFAIGLLFLVAPSGWLLRLFSPWATGFQDPPPWPTSQDPWGLGLIAVLAAKELPFLLWTAYSQLRRQDVALRIDRELAVACTMGYARSTAWWRLVWPDLWPRLRWPLLAVWAYGLTVVDVALVIGPGSPAPLAVLAWSWLLDADPTTNAQGAAAAWLLAAVLALVAGLAWAATRLPFWRRRRTDGRRGRPVRHTGAATPRTLPLLLLLLYLSVLLALALGSVGGVWAFPALLPQSWTLGAWRSVAASSATLATTFGLGLASAAAALCWSVAWLESAPPSWDAALRRLVYLPLVLPSVLWVVGLHATVLRLGMDAAWTGLWLAHALAALPYALIALAPAYTGFDPRYQAVSASLGRSRIAFLLQVKWPLLRAALSSAAAVAFAVSVAQYLSTLFVGAGRYATVTTEAVTLASGAQRTLTSAYAWLQWLLPLMAFALASVAGRPRRFLRRA